MISKKAMLESSDVTSYDIVDTAIVSSTLDDYSVYNLVYGPILALDIEGIKSEIHIENGYNPIFISNRTINVNYDILHVSQIDVVGV
jgi:hypothetical protein